MSRLISLITVLLMLAVMPAQVSAEGDRSLFVNLTSDETDRAVMAIALGTRVLSNGNPTTIFLNVDGVKLANTAIPQTKHTNGQTAQEMLSVFMKAGGRVIICPMCMEQVGGFGAKDLLDGVVMGGPHVTIPALMDDNVTVLSY